MKLNNYILLFFWAVLLLSCSGTSNIPKGDLLYTGHTIDIEKGEESKKVKKEKKSLEKRKDKNRKDKSNTKR